MKIRPYTDEEWDSLPQITMTGDNPWNPKCLDAKITSGSGWENLVYDRLNHVTDSTVDSYGRYCAIDPSDIMIAMAIHSNTDMLSHIPISYEIYKRVVPPVKNYDQLRKFFLHLPSDTIAKTYANSTQYHARYRPQLGATICDTYKSPFPALNVKRHNKAVATDTFSCDTAAVGSGAHMAQFFVGQESFFLSIDGMKSGKEFVNTLEDRSANGEPWISSSPIVVPMKSLLKFSMSYVTFALRIGLHQRYKLPYPRTPMPYPALVLPH
jgi:hypothetical protein